MDTAITPISVPYLDFDSGDPFVIELISNLATDFTSGPRKFKLEIVYDSSPITYKKEFWIDIKNDCADSDFVDTQTGWDTIPL